MQGITAQLHLFFAGIDLVAYSGALLGATTAIILGRLAFSKKR